MKRGIVGGAAGLLVTAVIIVPGTLPTSADPGGGTRSIPSSGTTSIRSLPVGADGLATGASPQARSGGRGR